MTLLDKIKEVLVDGNTSTIICNKIVDKYPEILETKTQQRGNQNEGKAQLRAEISSNIIRKEGIFFEIDRNERPHKYFFINETNVEEEEEAIGNIVDIEQKDIGYVYIINTQLSYKEKLIYKIGKAIDVDKRIKQLNNEQSAYCPIKIVKTYEVERPYKIEHAIHNILDKGRVIPNKEGFYADYVMENIKLIEEMIKIFKV